MGAMPPKAARVFRCAVCGFPKPSTENAHWKAGRTPLQRGFEGSLARDWCIQTDVNGSFVLVNRACWGWVFLTDVNGSIREADGVGGVCGGQREASCPSSCTFRCGGPCERACVPQTELNGCILLIMIAVTFDLYVPVHARRT